MRINQTKRYSIYIFLILLSCDKLALAQDSTARVSTPVFAQLSFLYDFPESYGLSAGIYLPVRSINKAYFSKTPKQFTKQREIVLGVNGGFYRYPYNYTGVLLAPFIGRRHYWKATYFTETSASIGVLRTFYDGKVYKVDAGGNVSEAGLFGRFYATTSFSYAFNWTLNNPSIALQLKPSLWFQYPYNSFIKPHASLELGFKYAVARRNVLVKTMNKSVRR